MKSCMLLKSLYDSYAARVATLKPLWSHFVMSRPSYFRAYSNNVRFLDIKAQCRGKSEELIEEVVSTILLN